MSEVDPTCSVPGRGTPPSGLTDLRWRIGAKKLHWHGHEILRRLGSFRKLRQPRGLKRFERRQFSVEIGWESDLVEVGWCWLLPC